MERNRALVVECTSHAHSTGHSHTLWELIENGVDEGSFHLQTVTYGCTEGTAYMHEMSDSWSARTQQ